MKSDAAPAPPDRTAPVIEAMSLSKSFGDTVAVSDLSFTVDRSRILGVLGPNGAGKTTTINMLTTLSTIGGGSASICGYDVATHPDEVRQVIGLAGQSAAVDEMLTARENLRLFGRLYKIPRSRLTTRIEELVENFRMSGFADRPVGTYSGGERRRLDVVAALIADPPALFLDEPTTGLDPRSRSELWQAIEGLAAAGTAIVLTTQYLEEADRLADEIVMIDRGTAVASGTPAQLKKDLEQDVLEVHVGSPGAVAEAVAVIGDRREVAADATQSLIRVKAEQGARGSLATLRMLEDAGIEIADFQLRSPTLDDVFLSLTGPNDAEVTR